MLPAAPIRGPCWSSSIEPLVKLGTRAGRRLISLSFDRMLKMLSFQRMNNQQFISDLLRSHGLRKTPNRIEMLSIFIKQEAALSASDIIAKMKSKLDRVTVYRALSSFEAHGILHRASEDERGVKYALCEQHCPDEAHADQHAHFVCNECHQTFCLEDVKVPVVTVSNKFSVDRTNYTLSGTCQACNT